MWPMRITSIMPAATMPRNEPHLELLEEVGGREEAGVALDGEGVAGAERQDDEDEEAGDRDRAVLRGECVHRGSAQQLEAVLDAEGAAGTEAHGSQQDQALEQRLEQRAATSKMRKLKEMARMTRAPNSEPIAPPEPPMSEVPPITTAAIEFSV